MVDSANDLAATLQQLASVLERLDPLGSGLRFADSLVDRSATVVAALGALPEAVASLSSLADRVHGILDDLEAPLRALAPHLTRASGSADRLGDLVVLLGDVSRSLGPLATLLRGEGPPASRTD